MIVAGRTCLRLKGTITLMLVGMVGCATVPKIATPSTPAKNESKQRKQDIVNEYEQRRDDVQYRAAVSKAQQGDTLGARKTLELLLERSPNHRTANLLAAEIALELNDPQQALALVEPIVKLKSADAEAQYTLGLALEGLNQIEQAKLHFAEAVRLSPENEVFRACLELVDLKKSRSTPVAQQPNSVQLVGYDESIDSDFDHDSHSLLDAGHLALVEGNLEHAMQSYMAAMSAAPQDPRIPRDAALELLQHNQTAAAVELLNHACRQFPRSVALLRTLATAQYRLGDYESSQVALQQALSLDNTDALAYFLLGAVRKKFGDQEGSARAIARAQQLDASLATHR